MTISVSAVGAALRLWLPRNVSVSIYPDVQAPTAAPPQQHRSIQHRQRTQSTSRARTTRDIWGRITRRSSLGAGSGKGQEQTHRRGLNQNCLLAAAFSVALLRYRQHAHLDNPRSHLNHSSEPLQAPLPVRPLLRPCLRRPARPAPQVRLHANQVDPPLPPVSQHPPALESEGSSHGGSQGHRRIPFIQRATALPSFYWQEQHECVSHHSLIRRLSRSSQLPRDLFSAS